MQLTVCVGSTSHRKIDVVDKLFKLYFKKAKIKSFGHSASSGVPDTPYGKQTYEGAHNRARECFRKHKAQYNVGLESGLVDRYGRLYEEAWACVITKNKEFTGYSSGLLVPRRITERMKKSKLEHCDVMTMIEKELGNIPNDTWGTYSGNMLLRELSLEEALRNAIVQLLPNKSSFY